MADIDGTKGNDSLTGTKSSDTIEGMEGDDTIYGGAGYDSMFGGEGNDTFYGDDDFYDDVYGGDGNDVVYSGNADNNWTYGGGGDDTVYGGDGREMVYGGSGEDAIKGGAGADTLYGGDGNDRIKAEAGNDAVRGDAGHDNLDAGEGDDSLYGGSGSDTMFGGGGDDLLRGEYDDDTLYGGDGNDTFEFAGDSGKDSIEGGDGADRISFMSGQDVTVSYTSGYGTYSEAFGGSVGKFSSIEEFETSSGNDTIDYSGDTDGASLIAGSGNDDVKGGSGSDRISTGSGNDTIYGGGGDDGMGGEAGDDTIYGETGNDGIGGGDGNDVIDGGDGDDALGGGAGDDVLTGGAGNDKFDLAQYGGADRITDFDPSDADADGKYNDQIDVSELRTAAGDPITTADVVVTDDGSGNALLTFPQGETLVLQGISPAQMSTAGQMYAAGIPCFTAGTMIRTPEGDRPVEALRAGDLVCTLDHGPQYLIWSGQRTLDCDILKSAPHMRPIRIAAGVCGPNGLLVSHQHGVMGHLHGEGRLFRARHLLRAEWPGVAVAKDVSQVTYVNLLFARHEIVFSNEIASESFYPGPWGLRGLTSKDLLGLLAVLPALADTAVLQAYGPPARRYPSFGQTFGKSGARISLGGFGPSGGAPEVVDFADQTAREIAKAGLV